MATSEEAGRWHKVARLLAAASVYGLDSSTVEALNREGWDALAALAGIHRPSDATLEALRTTMRDAFSKQ